MLHLITRLRNSKKISNWILVLSKLKFKTVTLCMLSLINCYHDLHKIVKLDIFVHHTSFLLLSLTRKLLFCPSISDHMYCWGTITYVKMNIVKKKLTHTTVLLLSQIIIFHTLKLKKNAVLFIIWMFRYHKNVGLLTHFTRAYSVSDGMHQWGQTMTSRGPRIQVL